MTPVITDKMREQMETLLKHGSRVEVLIEQGKVTIVEIKRKMRYKEGNRDNGSGKSNGACE